GPDRGRAHAVDRDGQAPEAPGLEQVHEQSDDLEVGSGRESPDDLRSDLPELTVAPGLRPAVTEHRSQIPEAMDPPLGREAALERGRPPPRRALGPEREVAALQVLEAIHLLLDYVARFAGGAREQLVRLEDWRSDLAVAVALQHLARPRFDPLPALELIRQEVAGAGWSLVLRGHVPACSRVRAMRV